MPSNIVATCSRMLVAISRASACPACTMMSPNVIVVPAPDARDA
jgi:hypothetical protein